ncbi:MAG TPA: hypothetical protein VFZ97_10060 [Acidimicrobiales bacterium]
MPSAGTPALDDEAAGGGDGAEAEARVVGDPVRPGLLDTPLVVDVVGADVMDAGDVVGGPGAPNAENGPFAMLGGLV